MLRTSFRRSPRFRLARAILLVVLFLSIVDLLALVWARPQWTPASRLDTSMLKEKEKVYIASIHWNNAAILRSNWTQAVLDLVQYLGPDNVYLSIYESGSWDDSKDALRLLDTDLGRLGVQRQIALEETTHADSIAETPAPAGWIDTIKGKKELRRIPYLSRLRNTSLKPLNELALKGIKFDKILFLNDVVFSTEDVVTLLSTRNGDYAAACSLDFSKTPEYYDTFALRDSDGFEAVTSTFPFFRSSASRDALITGRPVPVQSCWNGMVSFSATPFYSTPPLEFRGIPDSLARHHLEASECCLIHADNPLTPTHGVWLNPHVRVGYSPEAYKAIHPNGSWPSTYESIRGIWSNRIWRWVTPSFLKAWKISGRLRRWKRENEGANEPGVNCLVDEMQVLVWNGWAHV